MPRSIRILSLSLLFLAVPSLAEPVGNALLPQVRIVGPYGGDVRSLAVHPGRPDTFFLGASDGQLFRSTDAGRNWTRLEPGLGRRNLVIDNLHFDPLDPDTLYAAAWETKSSSGFFFVTRDGGYSWSELPLGQYQSSVRAVAIAPTDPQVIALGISEGVILSEDGGRSWDRITRGYRSLHNVESLVFDPTDSQTLYVGTWRRGWKTTNRGRKWVAIHQGMAFDSDMFSLLVSPDDVSTLYSSACTGIYKSQDGGLRWSRLTNGLPKGANRARMIHLDPADSRVLYAGTTVGLFRSRDSGASFSPLVGDIVVNAIAVHPGDSRIVLVGTDDAGILRSVDGGRSFEASNRGFTHRHIEALASSPRSAMRFAAVASDGRHGGLLCLDASHDWQFCGEGLPSGAITIRSIHPSVESDHVTLLTTRGVFRGAPGEKPFSQIPLSGKADIRRLAWAESEGAYFLAAESGLWRVSDSGGQPRKVTIPIYDGPVHSLIYAGGVNILYAGTDMGVFRSQDGGKTWSILSQGMPYASVELLHKDGERIFASTTRGLFLSLDQGESWQLTQGAPVGEVAAIASHRQSPQTVFAAEGMLGRLYRSDDGGRTWAPAVLGNRPSAISSLLLSSSGELLAGTLSDGLYSVGSAAATSSAQD